MAPLTGDLELRRRLQLAVESIPADCAHVLTVEEIEELCTAMKQRFVHPQPGRWWWTGWTVEYGSAEFLGGRGALRLLERLQPPRVRLLVGDSAREQLEAVDASVEQVTRLLRASATAEFYLIDPALNWTIAENHLGFTFAAGHCALLALQGFAAESVGIIMRSGHGVFPTPQPNAPD